MPRVARATALWNLQRGAGLPASTALWNISRADRRSQIARSLLEFVPVRLLSSVINVVDVGAHVGEWSSGVLRLFPSCNVTAFEPTRESADELTARFAGNPRVRVVRSAVGQRVAEAELHRFAGSDLNSLRPANGNLACTIAKGTMKTGTELVPVTTLDAELSDLSAVDFLKIDVQGGELDVLLGASRILARTKCAIVETAFIPQYEDAPGIGDIFETLVASGLMFYGFSNIARRPDGAAIWTDAIFCQ